MKMQMPREFYLPRESNGSYNVTKAVAGDCEIYTYSTKHGKPCAVAFHGKAAKPDWHFTFQTEAARDKKIAEYINNRAEYAQIKAKWKEERQKPHTLKIGDILSCSWGYDQTNIDYYQVTRVPGPHSVEIREIGRSSTPETGFMTAYCTPVPNAFKGEPMIKRCNSTNSVRIASYASASKWDGKPDRYSWYA